MRCKARDSSGRGEEIRTLDTVTRILPFQGSSFNHSDTPLYDLSQFFYCGVQKYIYYSNN